MVSLRFNGFAHTELYSDSEPGEADWSRGAVREVTKKRADLLLEQFPGVFELIPDPVRSTGPVRSPRTSAAAPSVTKAPAPKKTTKKKTTKKKKPAAAVKG